MKQEFKILWWCLLTLAMLSLLSFLIILWMLVTSAKPKWRELFIIKWDNIDEWCLAVGRGYMSTSNMSIKSLFKSSSTHVAKGLLKAIATTSLSVSSCFEISSPSMWTNTSTDILSFPSCNFPIKGASLFHSYNLCFSLSSSKAKFAFHVKGKILDILQLFLMFWGPFLSKSHDTIQGLVWCLEQSSSNLVCLRLHTVTKPIVKALTCNLV